MSSKQSKSLETACRICLEQCRDAKQLSFHVQKIHKISSREYTIKILLGGIEPSCPVCGITPRYVAMLFKKYCKEHSHVAEANGGKIGGKIKETWNKGLSKETDERLLLKSESQLGNKNHFFGKKHSKESMDKNAEKHRLTFEEVFKRVKKSGAILIKKEGFFYEDQGMPLDIVCKDCGQEDTVSLTNLGRCWKCKICHPMGSKQQIEIYNFVKSLGFADVVSSTREVIPPLELDIWVPSKNVAIEYHGLYWHSGGKEGTFDKDKHRKKFEYCREKNIKLLQIFSDEWIQNEEICKSMIKSSLGVLDIHLNARDCVVKEILNKDAKVFLEITHISGSSTCRKTLGLFHKTLGLVGVMTLRQPVQKK